MAEIALSWLKRLRARSPFGSRASEAIAQSGSGLAVMPSQKARSFSTRWSGALPAMMAALIAPIEMPATQSGWISASASACVDAGLVGAERAAALQHQGDAFKGKTAFYEHFARLHSSIHVANSF